MQSNEQVKQGIDTSGCNTKKYKSDWNYMLKKLSIIWHFVKMYSYLDIVTDM